MRNKDYFFKLFCLNKVGRATKSNAYIVHSVWKLSKDNDNERSINHIPEEQGFRLLSLR